jgi:hypothetical protein
MVSGCVWQPERNCETEAHDVSGFAEGMGVLSGQCPFLGVTDQCPGEGFRCARDEAEEKLTT